MSGILRTLRTLQTNVKKCSSSAKIIFLQYRTEISQQTFQSLAGKRIGPLGWLLLAIPSSTFALGTWQVQRKMWKENLIYELKTRTSITPIELPQSLEEISELEYHPVHVRGHFLHDKEIFLGPRSLIKEGDAATEGSLLSKGQSTAHGYLVVTPLKLVGRDETILVNRGWVSHKRKDPKTRPAGQIQNEVDIIGIIRLQENRPPFMPSNNPEANTWFYRDLRQMCDISGATPIYLDATDDFDVKGGPIGGQTRITLRNEHLSYIITWYGLCAFSSFMWYTQFIKGVRVY